jgi:hypothetical protein
VSNLPALSEAIMLKVFEGFRAKFREVAAWEFAKKQAFFDRLKSLMNYLLLLPDNPELEHFKNMLTLVDLIKSMSLKAADRLFYMDILAHSIHSLAIHVPPSYPQHQDKLPFRMKSVKSNDQLFKGAEFKAQIEEKLVASFEELYLLIEEVTEMQQHAEWVNFAMRLVTMLTGYFKDKAVINKTVKAALTMAGNAIKGMNNKGDKRRAVRSLKRTIRECHLEDNPKLNKLASQLYTFFDK